MNEVGFLSILTMYLNFMYKKMSPDYCFKSTQAKSETSLLVSSVLNTERCTFGTITCYLD